MLAPLIAQITAAFNVDAVEAVPAITAPADPARSLAAGTQLRALLADSDPGAGDFVEANRDVLRPLFDVNDWPQFETLVQGYAFADAQAQLEHALATSAGRQ